ncbi:alpha/beta hydrolase [uncultured Roseobacter sp.]|uniref:alpha/beta fold hydrolase n=1 Tax=uncultured Roseobacter sp. TaxID=114847 RepID=UPI00262BA4FE|nr:alpha/beta hydrolase [uncultured Roseobacter sp.]
MLKALGYIALFLVLLVLVTLWRANARDAKAAAEFPPAGQLVGPAGRQVHAEVFGSGPDVILIHGASGSTRDFTFDLVHRLKDRYRVIVLDRPGLGWTDRAGPAFEGVLSTAAESPARQAEMLQGAADALGVQNPIVVGHSYGGAVSLAWALSRPDRTAALVLLGAASQPWPGELTLQYRLLDTRFGSLILVPLIAAFAPAPLVHDSVESIFAPQPVPEGYIDHIGTDLTLRRTTQRANAQQVNSLRPHVEEMSQRYPSLDLPVEILHGTEDTTVPLHIHSEPLAGMLPDGELTRMEGVGHMPHHADPEAVVAAIDRAASRAGLR